MSLLYRSDWTGLDGGPRTYIASLDSKLLKSGWGIVWYRDNTNAILNRGAYTTYSKAFLINDDNRLSFGVSLGFNNQTRNSPVINQISYFDSIKNKPLNLHTAFNTNLGILYYADNFNIGISAFNIFFKKNILIDNLKRNYLDYNINAHFLLSGNYRFDIDKFWSINT